MQLCSVCNVETPKYRCPVCRIKYCSLGCYKKHKDACLPAQNPGSNHPGPKTTSTGSAERWRTEEVLHEDVIDKVPLQRLELLGQSKELRDLLYNPHLRQLLRSIDSAENKDNAMRAAMQEPLFVEFSDQCLRIVETEAFTSSDL